jgi:hypothetical protein
MSSQRGELTIDEQVSDFRRIFTMSEALSLLPELKVQFARFSRARVAASEAASHLDDLERHRTKENPLALARPLREAREDLGEQAERMRAVVRAVTEMGVEIKHLDPALIDFPALRDGRIVFLCWQEGESTIGHWHDIDAGFAGREPI